MIINADDLGASSEVNTAIEACIKEGLITSSTILACGEDFEGAVEIAKRYPSISFGAHLAIDEFKCLTESAIFYQYGLVSADGYFVKNAIKQVHLSSELTEAVYKEWSAQLLKIREAGIPISHIDGHHHLHLLPELEPVLERIMKENGIKCVRIASVKTISMKMHGVKTPKSDKASQLLLEKRGRTRKKGKLSVLASVISVWKKNNRLKKRYITTDLFCSYLFFYSNRLYFNQYCKNRTIELMCHPGHSSYDKETRLLSMFPLDCVKISYRQL